MFGQRIQPNLAHPINQGKVLWLLGGPSNEILSLGQATQSLPNLSQSVSRGGPPRLGAIGAPLDFKVDSTLLVGIDPKLVNLPLAGFTVAIDILTYATTPHIAGNSLLAIRDSGGVMHWSLTYNNWLAQVIATVDLSSTNSTITYGTNSNPPFGAAWIRILCTIPSNISLGKMYFNGRLYPTTNSTGTGTYTSDVGFHISVGSPPGTSGNNEFFADNICIWNRVLTPSEIYADWQESSTGYPGGLIRSTRAPILFAPAGKSVFAADAVHTSESATETSQQLKSATDAPTTTESAPVQQQLFRTTSESPASSNSASVNPSQYFRTCADALTSSESLAYTINQDTATDAVMTSETATRVLIEYRSTSDDPTSSEVAAPNPSQYFRTAAETVSTSESIADGTLHFLTCTEQVMYSEDAERIFVGYRTATDDPRDTESLSYNINGEISEYLTDYLSLTDATSTNFHVEQVSDNVTLTDKVSEYLLVEKCSDTITPTDTVFGFNLHQFVSDSVAPVDGTRNNFHLANASDSLSPNDSVTDNIHYQSVSDRLTLFDAVVTSGATLNFSLVDQIDLIDLVGRLFTESVSDSLSLTDDTERVHWLSDSVSPTDAASADQSTGVFDNVYITDSALPNCDRSLTLADSVTLEDLVNYWVIQTIGPTVVAYNGLTCRQDKIFAPNGRPPYSSPTTVSRKTVILTWPFARPVYTVTVRNPEFNNIDRKHYRRITRATRGGTFRQFRDPQWPRYANLNYVIHLVREHDSDNLLNFLLQSRGQQIGLLDFESRQWQGVVLTPGAQAEFHILRGVRSIQFEFEGALIDGSIC